MKKILILLAFVASLFGADATIEVVNRGASLPKIMIQDATLNFASDDIKERFLLLLFRFDLYLLFLILATLWYLRAQG